MLKGFWWAPVLTFVGLAVFVQWPLIEGVFSSPVVAVAPIRVAEPAWTPGAPGAATSMAATQATPRPLGSIVLASSRNPEGFSWAMPRSYQYTNDSNKRGLWDIAVGDVTGDGRPDVVSFNLFESDPTVDFRVRIYASTADGDVTLLPGLPFASGLSDLPWYTNSGGLAVEDFNNDGTDDIAVSYAFGVAIFTSDRKGGFTRRSYRMPAEHNYSATALIALDVDRDGALDLFQFSAAPRENTLYMNDGRGGFIPGRTIRFSVDPKNQGYVDHKRFDFDGDGYQDLVMLWGGRNSTPDAVAVYRNIGTAGMFATPSVFVPMPAADWSLDSLAVGDFNGDRVPEIVTAAGGNQPYWAFIRFIRRNESRQWVVAEKLKTLDIPNSMVADDVDGDGRDDLAIEHMGWDTISLFSGGDWEHPTLWMSSWNAMGPAHIPHALAIADLNGDGCKESMTTNTAYDLIVLWAERCHRHVRFSSDSGSKQSAQ